MGILNSRHFFGIPASASTAFNLVSVVAGVGLAFLFDPQADWRHPHFGARALYGVSLGVLLGGLAQLAIQLPMLWRVGFRFRWRIDWRDPYIRQIARLMGPSIVAGAAVQVNVLVNGIFASEIDGARSWLNCAFRLMQFPIGIFGVAIATVTLPSVARHHARDDLAAFGHTVEESLRLALFLTLPAAIGLIALAPQIIGVIYQHGEFMAWDTQQTALALRGYALGLAGYALIKVLAPCFYALELPRIPLRVSLLGIGLNLGSNMILMKIMNAGHAGLALSTSILAIVNCAQLLYFLSRHLSIGKRGEWMRYLAIVAGASLLCGAGAWWVSGYVARLVSGAWWPLAAGLAAGIVLYVGLTAWMRVEEMRYLMAAVRRRISVRLTGRRPEDNA